LQSIHLVRALDATGAANATFGANGALTLQKALTRSDAANTKVDAQYVGATSLLAASAHRGWMIATYGSTENTVPFSSLYVARFCR
jgi:hypothetical protein